MGVDSRQGLGVLVMEFRLRGGSGGHTTGSFYSRKWCRQVRKVTLATVGRVIRKKGGWVPCLVVQVGHCSLCGGLGAQKGPTSSDGRNAH